MFNIKHHILNVLIKTKLQNYLLKRFITSKKTLVLKDLGNTIGRVLDKNLVKNIRITYQTSESPDSNADIIPTLMLARFYAAIGKKVEFIWELDDLNKKAAIHKKIEFKANNYFSDQIKLIRMVLMEFDNVSIKTESPSETEHIYDLNFAINKTNQPLYRLAPIILDESIKIWTSGEKKIPESFYLDHCIEKNGTIAINFRYSTYDKRRNSSILSLRKDLIFINKHFPNRKIIIFSDHKGLEKVFNSKILSHLIRKSIKLEQQKSANYSEAVFEALKSDFFFMRKGGGMCVPLFYSKSSYLILDNDFTYFYSRSPIKIFSFSRPDQQFRKIISRFQLRKILIKYYSHITINT